MRRLKNFAIIANLSAGIVAFESTWMYCHLRKVSVLTPIFLVAADWSIYIERAVAD